MLLAIDVGNTNSVFSVSENQEIMTEWRCSTDGNMTSDQYGVRLMWFDDANTDSYVAGDYIITADLDL